MIVIEVIMTDIFAQFHDICSFVVRVNQESFSFSYKSDDFEDRFGEPATLKEWIHPDDHKHLAQDLEAFAYVRLLEQDNGYLPYFLKYLYSDDTLSGFCFPAPQKILGFENLEL